MVGGEFNYTLVRYILDIIFKWDLNIGAAFMTPIYLKIDIAAILECNIRLCCVLT